MMNILIFSKFVGKTGVGNHIKQLANFLNLEHKAIVVAAYDALGVDAKFYKTRKVDFNPINILKNIKELRRIIKKEKIDVVHCHHRMAALYMKIYRIFFKIPVVYSLHLTDVPCDWIHRRMTFAGERAIGVSSEVSEFMVEKLRIKKEKVTTVFNGVDDSQLTLLSKTEKREFLNRFDIVDGKTIIAMHSRIDEVKNHLLVVEAVHLLSKEEKENLVVVCGGLKEGEYYQKVLKKIEQYDLLDQFRFVGWVEPREILGIADVLIAPSFKEGFPLSVIESFLMKVPVVRTKTGGFNDQKYCYPISDNNPMDIVDTLRFLQTNRELVETNKELAYNYAKEHFVLSEMTKKTIKVYEDALKNGVKNEQSNGS